MEENNTIATVEEISSVEEIPQESASDIPSESVDPVPGETISEENSTENSTEISTEEITTEESTTQEETIEEQTTEGITVEEETTSVIFSPIESVETYTEVPFLDKPLDKYTTTEGLLLTILVVLVLGMIISALKN